MSIQIHLENFTGPLDLLLHLIKRDEMDICDIQIVEITEQYLTIIEQMKQLDLDIAGEFLVMAATLIYIKSKMLLPVCEEIGEEEEDPRAELVKRLLEYQRYKNVAELFQNMPQLERDIFVGTFKLEEFLDAEELEEVITPGIYPLAAAFHQLLAQRPIEVFHEVVSESLIVADYIELIVEKLGVYKRQSLRDIFSSMTTRNELIVAFLATLELVKMQLIEIVQVDGFSEVWLAKKDSTRPLSEVVLNEGLLGYG